MRWLVDEAYPARKEQLNWSRWRLQMLVRWTTPGRLALLKADFRPGAALNTHRAARNWPQYETITPAAEATDGLVEHERRRQSPSKKRHPQAREVG